jgi:cytochrome P450
LLDPESNELALLNMQKLFSSALGRDFLIGVVFPRALILLDFDEHRLRRRALSVAFKAGSMQSYLTELDTGEGRSDMRR